MDIIISVMVVVFSVFLGLVSGSIIAIGVYVFKYLPRILHRLEVIDDRIAKESITNQVNRDIERIKKKVND